MRRARRPGLPRSSASPAVDAGDRRLVTPGVGVLPEPLARCEVVGRHELVLAALLLGHGEPAHHGEGRPPLADRPAPDLPRRARLPVGRQRDSTDRGVAIGTQELRVVARRAVETRRTAHYLAPGPAAPTPLHDGDEIAAHAPDAKRQTAEHADEKNSGEGQETPPPGQSAQSEKPDESEQESQHGDRQGGRHPLLPRLVAETPDLHERAGEKDAHGNQGPPPDAARRRPSSNRSLRPLTLLHHQSPSVGVLPRFSSLARLFIRRRVLLP